MDRSCPSLKPHHRIIEGLLGEQPAIRPARSWSATLVYHRPHAWRGRLVASPELPRALPGPTRPCLEPIHRTPLRWQRALAALTSRLPIRGRERLADKLFSRTSTGDDWWSVRIGQGLRVRLPASSRQSWVAAFTGAYDEKQIELLASHVRPGSVVLDIGASLGLYTVQLAERVRAIGARVVAVEPIPANVDIIRENIAKNGLGAYASVLQIGLGIEATLVTMRIERGGSGNATVSTGVDEQEMDKHSSQGGLGPSVSIALTPLNDLSFDDPVSVIKIDAEGFEMDILAGGDNFVAVHRPIIFAEFSEPWMRSRGRNVEEPFEWAKEHSYEVYTVSVAGSGKIIKTTELRVTKIESSCDRGAAELLLVPR